MQIQTSSYLAIQSAYQKLYRNIESYQNYIQKETELIRKYEQKKEHLFLQIREKLLKIDQTYLSQKYQIPDFYKHCSYSDIKEWFSTFTEAQLWPYRDLKHQIDIDIQRYQNVEYEETLIMKDYHKQLPDVYNTYQLYAFGISPQNPQKGIITLPNDDLSIYYQLGLKNPKDIYDFILFTKEIMMPHTFSEQQEIISNLTEETYQQYQPIMNQKWEEFQSKFEFQQKEILINQKEMSIYQYHGAYKIFNSILNRLETDPLLFTYLQLHLNYITYVPNDHTHFVSYTDSYMDIFNTEYDAKLKTTGCPLEKPKDVFYDYYTDSLNDVLFNLNKSIKHSNFYQTIDQTQISYKDLFLSKIKHKTSQTLSYEPELD